MVIVEYRCPDGTPFPVVFPHAEDVERVWRIELEHSREPRTPLRESMSALGAGGGDRAFTELGLKAPGWFRPGPVGEGYPYFSDDPPSLEEMASMVEIGKEILERFGSAARFWTEHCLPLVKETCAWLHDARVDVPLADIARAADYSLQLTMVPMIVAGNDIRLLADTCRGLYGEEADLVANELAQGYPNATLEADQRLRALAQAARQSPRLNNAHDDDDVRAVMAQAREDGADPEFFAALDAFLEDYGLRAEAWDFAAPIWREQTVGFWAQLRQLARDDVASPEDAIARAADRRGALIAEVEARLGDDDTIERFRRRVERVKPYVAVREERAHWQLVTDGATRVAVRRKGAALVERGAIDAAEDVLYLHATEVEDGTGTGGEDADYRAVVSERRAEHQRRRQLEPPHRIGGGVPPTTRAAESLRGTAAGRGVASGTARVLRDLTEADRFEPGDVLVCTMTSPPWTPLFALAAAVVTDTGDIASHPGVAAREYGIPCVVGVAHATSLIPDGAIVRVDGTAGTVSIEKAPPR